MRILNRPKILGIYDLIIAPEPFPAPCMDIRDDVTLVNRERKVMVIARCWWIAILCLAERMGFQSTRQSLGEPVAPGRQQILGNVTETDANAFTEALRESLCDISDDTPPFPNYAEASESGELVLPDDPISAFSGRRDVLDRVAWFCQGGFSVYADTNSRPDCDPGDPECSATNVTP